MGEMTGEKRRVERQSACWWLFFKEAFLLDQSKGSTEQLWSGILHFSLSFCRERFAQRGSSGVECGLMMLNVLFFGHAILVFFSAMLWNAAIKAQAFNLVSTLNEFFETWKHSTGSTNALDCINRRVKKIFYGLWECFSHEGTILQPLL